MDREAQRVLTAAPRVRATIGVLEAEVPIVGQLKHSQGRLGNKEVTIEPENRTRMGAHERRSHQGEAPVEPPPSSTAE